MEDKVAPCPHPAKMGFWLLVCYRDTKGNNLSGAKRERGLSKFEILGLRPLS